MEIIIDKEWRFVDVIDGEHRCSYTPYDKDSFLLVVGAEYENALDWKSKPIIIKTKDDLLAELAAHRYALETGGILFSGIPVSTQRTDVDGYHKILKSLEKGWVQTTPLTKGEVTFDVDLPTMEALLEAISQHVDRVFKASDVHLKKITKLKTQAKIDEYDITQGWN